MSETLEQVLADARGELPIGNLSSATFRALALRNGRISGISAAQRGAVALLLASEERNAANGKNGARIMNTMTEPTSAPCALYYLADPRFPRWPRYVGITTNPESRLKRHRSVGVYNARLRSWKLSMRADGQLPEMHILAWYESDREAREVEWRLIHRWGRRGLCDCNGGWDGAWDATKLEWDARNTRRSRAS